MNKIIFLLLLLLPSIGSAQEVLIPHEKDGKWGYISFDTKAVVVAYQYDKAEKYTTHGTAKVKIGDKWGLLDAFGKELLPVKYDLIKESHNQNSPITIFLQLNKKWGLLDADFNLIIPTEYDQFQKVNGFYYSSKNVDGNVKKIKLNHLKAKKKDKWGIIDYQNNVILPIEYDDVNYIDISNILYHTNPYRKEPKIRFSGNNSGYHNGWGSPRHLSEKILIVKKGKQAHIITKEGKTIYTLDKYQNEWKYNSSQVTLFTSIDKNLKDEIFIINKNGKMGGVSSNGKLVIPFEYDHISYQFQNIFSIKKQDKYGLLNSNGEILQQPKYDFIRGHLVSLNEKHGILNPDLKSFRLPIEYEPFQEFQIYQRKTNKRTPLIHTKKNNREGLLDMEGRLVIPFDYQTIRFPSQNVENLIVQKNDKWGIIDIKNQNVLDIKYDQIKSNREWQVSMLIKKDGKYGMLNPNNGEWYIPIKYDSIHTLSRRQILVQNDNKWGMLNDKFETIAAIKYDEIKGDEGRIGEIWENFVISKKEQAKINLANRRYNPGVKQEGDKFGISDEKGEWLVPPIYDEITRKDYSYHIVKNGKVGVLDKHREFLIEPQYEEIRYRRYYNFIKAKKNGKWGIISQNNETLVPFEYERIEGLTLNRIKIYDGEYWSLVNEKGKKVIDDSFSDIFLSNNFQIKNLIYVGQLYRSGIIDFDGNYILPIKFQSVRPSISKNLPQDIPELFPVKLNDKWGYAKKGGEIVIPCQFEDISHFNKEIALIKKNKRFFPIDKKGNILTEKGYVGFKGFNDYSPLAIVYNENIKYGAINQKGEETIPVIYDEVKTATLGRRFYQVKLKDKYGILDHNGKIKIPIQSETPFGNIHLGIQYNHHSSLKGLDGKLLLSGSYDNAKTYYKNYYIIRKDNKLGIIDILTEDIVLPIEYDKISGHYQNCSMDFFIVQKGTNVGLVNKSNQLIFPIEYDAIFMLPHLNSVVIKKDQKFALANFEGKLITSFEYEEISQARYQPLPAKKNGQWGYINTNGKIIHPFELEKGNQFYPYYDNQKVVLKNSICNLFPLPEGVQMKAYIQKGEFAFSLSTTGELTAIPKQDKYKSKLTDNIYKEVNPNNWNRYLVNEKGEKILPYNFSMVYNHCNGFIPFVIMGGKDGFYFPQSKKEIIYDGVQINDHDNAPIRWIRENQEYGFIDNEGKEITPIHFERVGRTHEGMISILKDGKMGFLNELGEMKIPMKFDDDGKYLPRFENGIAYAYLDGKYGFIDQTGKTVAPFEFEAIAYFTDGVAIAYRKGKWEELVF